VFKRVYAAATVAGAVLTIAGAAPAQTPWKTYTNPDLGFSVDTPTDPKVQSVEVPTPIGNATTLIGVISLGDNGGMMFSVTDYTSLLKGQTLDPDTGLEGAVQGGVNNVHGVLDSEEKIQVGGDPGREFTAHTDTLVVRTRIVLHGDRLYSVLGIGTTQAGVPQEFSRFEQSLAIAH
jgi:hypothetical protein